jgi:hypothetical protein
MAVETSTARWAATVRRCVRKVTELAGEVGRRVISQRSTDAGTDGDALSRGIEVRRKWASGEGTSSVLLTNFRGSIFTSYRLGKMFTVCLINFTGRRLTVNEGIDAVGGGAGSRSRC